MQLKETLLSLFLKAVKIIICMHLGLVKSFEQTKRAMAMYFYAKSIFYIKEWLSYQNS